VSEALEANLDFRAVAFAYGSQQILNGLNLHVRPGEVVGFLGVNGSGKTTTFLLATGFLAPSSGSIKIAGFAPRSSRQWCAKVGVVNSGAGHYNRLTVRRNLAFFASLYGAQLDLEAHMRAYGLSAVANKPAGQLSQGYRQRLSLARATVHQPRLLLLDEPSDGLDPGATEELHQSVRRFADGGGGVLLTSHRVEEVETLCHRVVLLADGVATLQGTPQELGGGEPGGLRARLLAMGGQVCAHDGPMAGDKPHSS
jgi:ABC-2 type transport system ATP-binding protein